MLPNHAGSVIAGLVASRRDRSARGATGGVRNG
jgi:hypothetical protein